MNVRLASFTMAALGVAAAPGAWATEYGTVLSSTPVVVSTPVLQRECTSEPAATAPSRGSSGVGALAGAVMGAALGNALGKGSGRAVATGVGMIAGAALGNHAEAEEASRQAPAAGSQRCRDVTRYEQRTVGYDVVYEYQGVRRSVRLAQAPGDRLPLEVQVAPLGQIAAPTSPAVPAPLPAARPVYRSPADNVVDDDAVPVSRAVYAPAPVPATVVQPVAVNPWPYIVAGGIGVWAISEATRSHRHGPPRPRHWHGPR